MTLAEVYEALGKQDGGEALASTIKAEISKINAEAAKQRTAKNAIAIAENKPGVKHSIITGWKISEARLQNYLRMKTNVYSKE